MVLFCTEDSRARVLTLANMTWTTKSLSGAEFGGVAPLGGGKYFFFRLATASAIFPGMIYDVATDGWTTTSAPPVGRSNVGVAPYGAGRALVFGGTDGAGVGYPKTSMVYTAATNAWTTGPTFPGTASMSLPRVITTLATGMRGRRRGVSRRRGGPFRMYALHLRAGVRCLPHHLRVEHRLRQRLPLRPSLRAVRTAAALERRE